MVDQNNKKVIFTVIFVAVLTVAVIGTSLAFFNYTRTGSANTIKVGRVYFNHEEGTNINLSNVFPISSEQAETDTVNAKTLSITVVGDTDYDKGIEYVVTLDSVNNTINNKKVPINLEISVTGEGLGTEEQNDYYTNRDNYTESKYKIEYDGNLEQDKHLLVGYISSNTTKGTIEGINGTINIKAYIDKDKILISDTYPEGTTTIDGVEYYNGTPTTDRMVLTTEEWNSFAGSNGLSFKVKVEANEGIWVEKPLIPTPASCFTITENNNEVTITNYDSSCESDVVIPSKIDGKSVTTIGKSAFYDIGLTSVTIPNGVRTIKTGAFAANDLTSVTIPNSVEYIDGNAFSYNYIPSVNIPNSVTFIDCNAFLPQRIEINITYENENFSCSINCNLANGGVDSECQCTAVGGVFNSGECIVNGYSCDRTDSQCMCTAAGGVFGSGGCTIEP